MHLSSATPVFAMLAAVVVAQQEQAPPGGRLRHVRASTSDVFGGAELQKRPVFGALVNAVHWETREGVVRREVWMRPGEVVTPEQAAELERNLRALGLFAEVDVRLVPVGGSGEVDLEIVTRDRLTLNFGAGASLVGGVTGFRTAVGESNLFGSGDRIGASFTENSEGEFRGSVFYDDLHVLDSWHTARLRASRTDDGDSFGFSVRRPFKHLADPRGHGFSAGHDEGAAEYYRGGDSVAEVQVTTNVLAADLTWASGPEHRRFFSGPVVSFDDRDYGAVAGPLAPSIRVPGDTLNAFVGWQARWAWIDGYREVAGVDTIEFVQDLELGLFFGGTVGARWRDEEGMNDELQPRVAADVRWAAEPFEDVFVDLAARGSLRWNEGRAAGFSSRLGAWAFALTGESNSVGANVVYDVVEENQDLPRELTLGEDSGLRGYPAREFAGNARLRINVEDRFDTGLELLTLRFGTVVFFDAGWIGDDGDLGRPYESAGVGLRIGSRPLLGGGVFRIDVARPFFDIPGEDEWLLSATVGQVFEFGGNR